MPRLPSLLPIALLCALGSGFASAGELPPPAKGSLLLGSEPVAASARFEPDGSEAALVVEASLPGASSPAAFRAPRAACLGCSGARMVSRWSAGSVSFASGRLLVEHRGGAGSDFWAWRTEWALDPVLRTLRLERAQRIGPLPDGSFARVSADWSSGWREDAASGSSPSVCRVPPQRPPDFASLSADALASGLFLPECSPR